MFPPPPPKLHNILHHIKSELQNPVLLNLKLHAFFFFFLATPPALLLRLRNPFCLSVDFVLLTSMQLLEMPWSLVLQPPTEAEAFTTIIKQKHPSPVYFQFFKLTDSTNFLLCWPGDYTITVHPLKDLDCITFTPSVTWHALGKSITESCLQTRMSHSHTSDRFVSGRCQGAFWPIITYGTWIQEKHTDLHSNMD